MIYTLHKILLGLLYQEGLTGYNKKCIQDPGFKSQCMEELGRYRCWWEDNIKMDLREICCEDVTGFSWFRLGSTDRLLWTWWWIWSSGS